MSDPGLQERASEPAASPARPGRSERRLALVEAAIQAIARHGPGVSMAQMAAQAGVTKPILYRHFGDRSGLVAALTRRYLEELRQELDGADAALPLRERTRRQFELGLGYLQRRRGLLAFIDRERGFALSEERAGEHAEGLVTLVGTLLESRGLDPRLAPPLAHGIGGLIVSATLGWLNELEQAPDRALPLEDMASAATDLIFGGIEGLLGGSPGEATAGSGS